MTTVRPDENRWITVSNVQHLQTFSLSSSNCWPLLTILLSCVGKNVSYRKLSIRLTKLYTIWNYVYIKKSKTECVVASSASRTVTRYTDKLQIGRHNFEEVKWSSYLGLSYNWYNVKGKNSHWAAGTIFQCIKSIVLKLSLHRIKAVMVLFQPVILPVLIYSPLTWMVSKQRSKLLATFLQWIFGLYMNELFRCPHNNEICLEPYNPLTQTVET